MGGKKKKERRELDEKIEKLNRKLERTLRKRESLDGGPVVAVDPGEAPAPEQASWTSPEAPEVRGPGPVAATERDVLRVIRERRSIKRFTDRQVPRALIEGVLEAAVLAPNHHLTEPWRFYVLGAAARRAYGDALGIRKARRVDDADAAIQVREKVAREHEALPAMIAVAMKVSEDAERLREDYAAAAMAIAHLCLAATAYGLGTHIKTGAIMDDPAARDAVGAANDERIVSIVNLGWPAEVPAAKARRNAADVTTWRD